jgi:hypothetical protein
MANREIFNSIKIESVVRAQVLTATPTATVINMSDASSVNFVIDMGNSGDTLSGSVYWTISLEDSPDNSVFTAVTDAESLLIAIDGTKQANATSIVVDAPTEDTKIFEISYKNPGNKQYLKLLITATGTHSVGTPMSASAIKGYLKVEPEAGKANA